MKTCKNCGKELVDYAVFCINCGSKQERINQAPNEPTINPDTNIQYIPEIDAPSNPDFNASMNPGYNPDFNTSMNPGFNPDFNQPYPTGMNPGFNPDFNTSPNPDFNPNFNASMDPGFNPNFNQPYPTGMNPGFNPENNQPFNPGYNLGYNPGFNPNMAYAPVQPVKKKRRIWLPILLSCVGVIAIIAIIFASTKFFKAEQTPEEVALEACEYLLKGDMVAFSKYCPDYMQEDVAGSGNQSGMLSLFTNDQKITYKSKQQLSQFLLDDLSTYSKEHYKVDVTFTEGYTINLTVSYSMLGQPINQEVVMTMVNYNGKWCAISMNSN